MVLMTRVGATPVHFTITKDKDGIKHVSTSWGQLYFFLGLPHSEENIRKFIEVILKKIPESESS